MTSALTLAILGFLHEQPLHGYDLRVRIARLSGHASTVSHGTLYPAIKRMEAAGLLTRQAEPGAAAAPRHMLGLTEAGEIALLERLRAPADVFITDENRWFILLSFLRHLGEPHAQAAVLRRRLDFLSEPSSFFYDGTRPLTAEEVDDPFRRGVLRIARATSTAEIDWLTETLRELTDR
ncbi:PadR family transcriptional regulator [Nocardia sp. NPDC052566]|uniref:PadR family transcriptional regulator n=1 Tax=Nocardia sp. NPDC052566 TaxID=3364330 RepID=UPI0037C6DC95